MTRLTVDLHRLADLVDRMQLFQDHLLRAQDDVAARMRAMHGTWTGDAAVAQSAAHAQWASATAELQDALGVLRSIVSTAHGNYGAAITANRQMWAR